MIRQPDHRECAARRGLFTRVAADLIQKAQEEEDAREGRAERRRFVSKQGLVRAALARYA